MCSRVYVLTYVYTYLRNLNGKSTVWFGILAYSKYIRILTTTYMQTLTCIRIHTSHACYIRIHFIHLHKKHPPTIKQNMHKELRILNQNSVTDGKINKQIKVTYVMNSKLQYSSKQAVNLSSWSPKATGEYIPNQQQILMVEDGSPRRYTLVSFHGERIKTCPTHACLNTNHKHTFMYTHTHIHTYTHTHIHTCIHTKPVSLCPRGAVRSTRSSQQLPGTLTWVIFAFASPRSAISFCAT
jgi:hypothetical protein